MYLTDVGDVYSVGCGEDGQLGMGETFYVLLTPRLVDPDLFGPNPNPNPNTNPNWRLVDPDLFGGSRIATIAAG